MSKKDNNSGPGVIKDLSLLGSLIKEATKPPKISVPVRSPVQVVELNPEDDLLDNIFAVMSDYKGRTISEIECVLSMQNIPIEDVVTLVKLSHNTGSLIISGRHDNPIYTLKKGFQMANNNQEKNTPYRPSRTAAPVSEWDPEGRIIPAEGIDVAIWKVTRDRKSRYLDEIGELLRQFGFLRENVRDRVIFLANKHWFDRMGSGKQTKYTLKKGIPMPKPANAPDPLAESDIKVNSTTTFHTRSDKHQSWHERQAEAQQTQHPQVSQSQPMEEAVQAVPQPQQSNLPTIQSAPNEDLTVTSRDNWYMAIWKTMRDYNEYTAQEVSTLLSDFFNPKTTQIRMSKLYLDHHWFERRTPETGPRNFKYLLKKEIDRPTGFLQENIKKSDDAKEPEVPKVEVKQDELPNIQPEQSKAEDKPVEQKPSTPSVNPVRAFGETEMRLNVGYTGSKQPFVPEEVRSAASKLAAAMPPSDPSEKKAPVIIGATLAGARENIIDSAIENAATDMTKLLDTQAGRDALTGLLDASAKESKSDSTKVLANATKDVLAESKQETPQQPMQAVKEDMTTNQPQVPQENKPVSNLSGGKYLKFMVQVKDIPMTIEEARQLHNKLQMHGFGTARKVPTSNVNDALFAANYRIKGKDVTETVVQEIALELEEFGFGDSSNFA